MNKNMILLLLLSVIIFTGCMSPEKAIEKFENSIEEENAEALYKLVNLEEDVYWSKKEAEDVINYFVENKSVYTEQLSLLHDQKDAFKEKKELTNTTGILYFNDKKELFVRTYEVSLNKDSFVDFEELVVSVLEDEEIKQEDGSGENIALGLFGPGYYRVEGQADYGYVLLEDYADFELLDNENFNEEIVLDLKGEEAKVFSTQPETTFYINEDKIEQDISAKGGITIQPLVNGLTLQSKSEFSWGELVSEEVEYIGEGTSQKSYDGSHFQPENEIDLTPHIFVNEQDKEEIAHIITDFNEKLLKSLAENDPSYLDDVIATDEAKAAYDSDFELLTSVEKGEVTAASFPLGTAAAFIGHYKGGLMASIIDFTHAENLQDEETNEDLLVLKVNLKTNFFYIPKDYDESKFDKDSKNYLEPFIHLKKENDRWMIAEQLINLKVGSSELELTGEKLVKTEVKQIK